MANLPAAKKSIRADKKKEQGNKALKSKLRTLIKKLNSLISAEKQEDASNLLKDVMSTIDKAAKKGILKKNTASRKKSGFSSRIFKIAK